MKYYKVEARIEFTIAVPDYADETTLIDFVDSTESWIDPDSIMLTQIDHDVWASQADDWRQTAKFDRNGQLEWRNEPDTVHDGATMSNRNVSKGTTCYSLGDEEDDLVRCFATRCERLTK